MKISKKLIYKHFYYAAFEYNGETIFDIYNKAITVGNNCYMLYFQNKKYELAFDSEYIDSFYITNSYKLVGYFVTPYTISSIKIYKTIDLYDSYIDYSRTEFFSSTDHKHPEKIEKLFTYLNKKKLKHAI